MAFIEILSELGEFAKHLVEPNIDWFNADKSRVEDLADMLLPHRNGVSLRLADHLVVQYAREHVIMVDSEIDNSVPPCDLWLDYRRTLSGTGKKYFDVFKRKNAIRIKVFDTTIETTIGQIVFLSWYGKRNLHGYMREHETAIRQHMKHIEKTSRDNLKNGKRKTRSASKSNFVKPGSRVASGSFKMFS
jgi:hypothetical protein